MNHWLRTIGAWFEARLCFRESLWPMLTHPIPKSSAGPMGWWYVFGSASLTLLLVQIITGIGLALVWRTVTCGPIRWRCRNSRSAAYASIH